MGTVLRLLGRDLRALGVGAALSTLIFAGADAQTATTPLPVNRSLVSLPENQVPSMRLQNFSGSVYERLAIRRGLVAGGAGAAAVGGATWAGKELSQRMPTATASTWRSITVGGIEGAVQGAVSGCIAGAAGGLVTAGALSGPGCAAGALGMAIIGGFYGAYGAYINLDEGGKIAIKIDDLNKLIEAQGALVNKVVPGDNGPAPHFAFLPNSSTSSYQAAFNTFGFNKTFICSGARNSANYAECMFYDAQVPRPDGDLYGVIRSDDSFQMTPNLGFCAGYYRQNTCVAGNPTYTLFQPSDGVQMQVGSTASGHQLVLVARDLGVPTTQAKPTISSTTYSKTPLAPAWATVLGSQINSSANQLKLSNELLAGMLNALHKQMTSEGSLPSGVPAYDPSDPITPADIQAVKNAYPSFTPTVGDLSKPFTTPGREPVGGTAASPVSPPQDVNVVGGSTGTGTGAGGTVKAELDLGPTGDESLPTASQEAKIPMWDQITSAVDPWRNLKINWPAAGACPVYPIDVPNFFGRNGHWEIDAHCQLLEPGWVDALLGLFLTVVYTLAAVRLFLKA